MTRTTNGITIATIGMSATTTTRTPMQEEAILPRNKTRRSSLIFFLVLLSVVILICDNTITSSTLHLLITKGAPETLTNSTFQREQVHASINTFHNISHDRNDQPPQFWNISIVVQLSGELGNHLSKLAFGYAIQRRLWDHYAIPSHLVLQHQSSRKWIQARQDVQKCFPQFRSMDFTQGNTLEFQERLSEQQKWLGNENSSKLVLSNLIHSHEVEEKLIFLKSLLEQSSPITKNHGSTNNISLPFLYAQSFASWEYIDTYYHGLKRLFAFDDDACCRELPKPEEYVFVSTLPKEQVVLREQRSS